MTMATHKAHNYLLVDYYWPKDVRPQAADIVDLLH
jgi:hypothetical protein